jgi:hypothetical protein
VLLDEVDRARGHAQAATAPAREAA